MKIGIITCNEWGNKTPTDGSKMIAYNHLIIESSEDIAAYRKIYEPMTAEKNMNAWFGFRSQTFRKTFSDYLVHEMPSRCAETILLSVRLDFKTTDTSLIEFCSMSDKTIYDKLASIMKYVSQGKIVVLNHKGGFSFLDDLDKYDSFLDPTEKQLASYINIGKVDDENFCIRSKTVVVENSDKAPESFLSKLDAHIDRNNLQILSHFKVKTIGFKDEDFISLFQEGIDRGMRNICFETTGQDLHNIIKLHALLKKIIEMNQKTTLKVYYSTNDEKVIELFDMENCFNIK